MSAQLSLDFIGSTVRRTDSEPIRTGEITREDRFDENSTQDRFEPIEIESNRSSPEIPSTYDRFEDPLSYGERDVRTGSSRPGPLTREESFASLSSPCGQGDRANEPREEDSKPVSGDPNRRTDREEPPPESSPEPAGDRRAPTLRPYQLEAISSVRAEWQRGIRRTLLVLPTGCGKTVVFAALVRWIVSLGDRALVLAHRNELLEQAQRKLDDVGVWAAIEKAEKRAGIAPVVVASVQTLQGKRLELLDAKQFKLIVVDEGHHAPAISYRKILDHFPDAWVLLVTATPDRADGKALGEICESVAYSYELRDAIRDGWLAPIRARRIVVAGVDLSKVKTRAGDLALDGLANVMATDEAVLGTVIPLLEQAGDRRTIVFAVNIEHAYALAGAIRDRRPGAARVAHGELDARERADILADFRRGDFQFLVNVALYTEGFDEPSIECVAVVRPTKSRGLFVQMVGRGTRLFAGKTECLLLDFTGNAGKHKLVGPLDALAAGANVEADVRKEADRLLEDEQLELDQVLELAEQQLAEKRKAWRLSATAKYFAKDVDPFFGTELGPEIDEPWARELATNDLRDRLAAMGMKRIPPGITMGEAVRILNADKHRRDHGLASYKQSTLLARFGVDPKELSRSQASDRIAVIANYRWPYRPGPERSRCLAVLEQLDRRDRGEA